MLSYSKIFIISRKHVFVQFYSLSSVGLCWTTLDRCYNGTAFLHERRLIGRRGILSECKAAHTHVFNLLVKRVPSYTLASLQAKNFQSESSNQSLTRFWQGYRHATAWRHYKRVFCCRTWQREIEVDQNFNEILEMAVCCSTNVFFQAFRHLLLLLQLSSLHLIIINVTVLPSDPSTVSVMLSLASWIQIV